MKAAYAVQPRILTKSDVESTGELKHSSYRSKEYLERNLSNSQDVRQEGIALAKSFCYAMNNQGAKTRNFVVHIEPEKATWDDCGIYEETVTSQTLNSALIHPQNRMDPNENLNNESFFKTNLVQDRDIYPHQNSQSPPASQDQASQNLHLGHSYLKNQTKESQNFYRKKNAKQSYIIIPRNSQDPTPISNHVSVRQPKPSSSYNKDQKHKITKPLKYSTEMNQNEGYFEGEDALMSREERQVFHPILRRNGFK